jgi:hypothetical protein
MAFCRHSPWSSLRPTNPPKLGQKVKADAQKTAVSKLFVMHLCICKILNLPKCIYQSSDPTPILGVIIEISMKQKLGMCKLQVNMSEYKRD